jgi:hypothetical protein
MSITLRITDKVKGEITLPMISNRQFKAGHNVVVEEEQFAHPDLQYAIKAGIVEVIHGVSKKKNKEISAKRFRNATNKIISISLYGENYTLNPNNGIIYLSDELVCEPSIANLIDNGALQDIDATSIVPVEETKEEVVAKESPEEIVIDTSAEKDEDFDVVTSEGTTLRGGYKPPNKKTLKEIGVKEDENTRISEDRKVIEQFELPDCAKDKVGPQSWDPLQVVETTEIVEEKDISTNKQEKESENTKKKTTKKKTKRASSKKKTTKKKTSKKKTKKKTSRTKDAASEIAKQIAEKNKEISNDGKNKKSLKSPKPKSLTPLGEVKNIDNNLAAVEVDPESDFHLAKDDDSHVTSHVRDDSDAFVDKERHGFSRKNDDSSEIAFVDQIQVQQKIAKHPVLGKIQNSKKK